MSNDNRQRKTEYKVAPTTPQPSNMIAEEQWCSAVLADVSAYGATRDIVTPDDFYHPKPRAIAEAAAECIASNPVREPTRANIAERLLAKGLLDTAVKADYLQKLDDGGYPSIVTAAVENATTIRQHAQRREIIKTLRIVAEEIETTPDSLDAGVSSITDILNKVMTRSQRERDPSILAWLDEEDGDPPAGKPTPLDWINGKAFGFGASMVHSITAPPKRRKTTLMRNLVLDALIDGTPVSWFTVDGTYKDANRALLAMLATRIMKEKNVPVVQWTLSDRGLPQRMRTKEQHDAIEMARDLIRTAQANKSFRMYYSGDGFTALSRLQSLMQRDITMYHRDRGDKASVMVIDYIQDLQFDGKRQSWNDSDFEQSCKVIGNLTRSNGLTTFILSQPTRATGDSDDDVFDDDMAVIHDKGGGALLQLVDYGWTVKVHSERPDEMRVVLREVRRAKRGHIDYTLNPSSGLILNPNEGTYKSVEGY